MFYYLIIDCVQAKSLFIWQTQGKQYKIYNLQNYTRNFNLIQDRNLKNTLYIQ